MTFYIIATLICTHGQSGCHCPLSSMFDNSELLEEDDLLDDNDFEDFAVEASPSSPDPILPSGWIFSPSSLLLPPPSLTLEFPSRQAAFQALSHSSALPVEGQAMFLSLHHEGWRESEVLPQGWIYKRHGDHLLFLSNEGDFIQYFEAFLAWLQASGKYSSLEKEIAKQFQDIKAFERYTLNEITNKDDQLMIGKFEHSQIKEKETQIMRKPEIEIVVADLIEYEIKLEETQTTLEPEIKIEVADIIEWKTNPYLPEGWLCKDSLTKSGKLRVLTSEGLKLCSYKSIIEFMKSNPKYSDTNISNIYLYPDGKNHAPKHLAEEWKPNDYLPQGWLGKEKRECTYFLKDENGTKFASYRSAVEFMKAYPRYSEEDQLRIYRYPDGGNHEQQFSSGPGEWKESNYLPEGWVGKEYKEGNKFLMNDNGKSFSSYKAAVEAMKSDPKYSEEEISRAYLYPDGKNHKQYRSSGEWKQSAYLPDGWLGKKKRDGLGFLMNKSGKMYSTYKTAAEAMKSDPKYSEQEISRLYLYPDGKNHKQYSSSGEWKQSDYLPKGWLGKAQTSVGTHFLMDVTGTKFSSYISAVEYIKLDHKYSQAEILRLYLFPDGKNHEQYHNSQVQEWTPSNYLPLGWLGRQNKDYSGLKFLMSDDGTKFNSYLAATSYMELLGSYTKEAIDRLYMYPDGKSQKTKSEAGLKRNNSSSTLIKIVAKKVKQDNIIDETKNDPKENTLGNILVGLDITVSKVVRNLSEEKTDNSTKPGEPKTTVTTDEEKQSLKEMDQKITSLLKKCEAGMSECKVCGKQTKTMLIKSHIESAHVNISQPCNLCGNIFKTRNSLSKHKSTYHKNIETTSD